MNNTRLKLLISCILIVVCANAYAQNSAFQQRLAIIDQQLELMSDTLVTGLNEIANFSVSNVPIQTFLRSVAESHRLNVQVDASLGFLLTNNFTNVSVKDLIYFLCEEYQLDIRFTGTIMSFFKFQEPKLPDRPYVAKKLGVYYNPSDGLMTFDLSGDTLQAVVREITRVTNINVVALGGREIEGKLLNCFIKGLRLESALDKLAYVNGLKLTKSKDGIFILELQGAPPGQNGFNNPSALTKVQAQGEVTMKDSLLTVDVVNYPIMEIISQASVQIGVDFILFSDVAGTTTAKVKSVTYDNLLSFIFQGTNYTYKRKSGVYLIAQRSAEGFRSTELIRLDYRTTENILLEIPSELVKDVDIKIHKELNSLIVTGNKQKIDELVAFVKLVDRPIPNILIEVIVVDVRKGYSIETGLKAFLSPDSIPKTQGQVFPGLDVTLSSRSINDALQRLDSKGIVNLGRVTPSFYMQLKALEQSNNIQVRSTPKLSTMNGSKANLIIGESVYYVETTQNITGGVNPLTTTTQQFNKVEANLAINISPIVSGNEHITLDITAEFSDFVDPTIPNAPPGNTTRKFESKIRIRNEEMIILGGLEELSKSDVGSGVPLISRIPILKWIFSSKTKRSANNRLIVFIKPTLVY